MSRIELEGKAALSISAEATLRLKHNLAIHHLFAACRSVGIIGKVEHDHVAAKDQFGDFWDEILQHSLVVATLTVAFLEANANDLYFDGKLDDAIRAAPGIEATIDMIHRKGVLDKYDIALQANTGNKLPRGDQSVQDVEALINLRDRVIHFKPEWSGAPGLHEDLSKQLNYKFERSPFLLHEENLFPIAWASHSFARWALQAAVTFVQNFHASYGKPSPLDLAPHQDFPFRKKLELLSAQALRF